MYNISLLGFFLRLLFELTPKEFENLRSQISTSSWGGQGLCQWSLPHRRCKAIQHQPKIRFKHCVKHEPRQSNIPFPITSVALYHDYFIMATKIQKSDTWTPPPLTMENFNEADAWWRYTHIFLEWNSKGDCIYPCFGIVPPQEETFEAAKLKRGFHKLELFGFDVENRDEKRFNLLINMEKAFLFYFKEIFDIRAIEEGYHYSFDLSRIVLPKKTSDEIMKVITEHNLTEVSELIFYIISKAQDFYTHKVKYYESKEQQSIINNIESETNKAIDLIERVLHSPFEIEGKNKIEDTLLRINFIFQNSNSIKIKDPMLTHQFVRQFKEHYDDSYYKNWKLQLQLTKYYYQEDKIKSQFRYRYAIALYNFFTKTGLIKLQDRPYPNNLLDCISKILEFSLIKIETSSDKVKVPRNWLKDHTLTQNPITETVKPDFGKLYKYFDKDLIDCVSDEKRADAIKNGLSLCLKYQIQSLQNEIVHLVACLRNYQWRLTQQLERGPIIPNNNPLPKEYEAFKLFVESSLTKKQFENIKFKIEGDTKSYSLTDKLPIHLIQTAIINHYHQSKEDYETDILQAVIKNGEAPDSFSSKLTGNFNTPEERFFPKFVDSFIKFLEGESIKIEKEYKPRDRFYSLIGKALHITGYIPTQFIEDWQLKSKSEHWHSLLRHQENKSKKTPSKVS